MLNGHRFVEPEALSVKEAETKYTGERRQSYDRNNEPGRPHRSTQATPASERRLPCHVKNVLALRPRLSDQPFAVVTGVCGQGFPLMMPSVRSAQRRPFLVRRTKQVTT